MPWGGSMGGQHLHSPPRRSEDARKCPRLPAWVKRLLLVALGLALLVLASTTLLCPPAPPFPLTLKYLNGPPPT